MSNEKEKIAEDYIKSFLHNIKPDSPVINPMNSDLYQDLPLESLPMHKLYHPNSRIEIRALNVGEITNYSTLESNDPVLVRTKLDEVLSTTVKFSIMPREKLNYKHLLVNDRLYVIYALRELTFQNGRILSVACICSKCSEKFDIELLRKNLEFWTEQEPIWRYYNPNYGVFAFNTTIQDDPYLMRPPTVGLQESFYYWIKYRKELKQPINPAFVKIAPYTINGDDLSIDELNELQDNFAKQIAEKQRGVDEFQFLNDTVEKFKKEYKIGIRGLLKLCPKCGTEVRTPTIFPKRARDLFIIPNAFGAFIKE